MSFEAVAEVFKNSPYGGVKLLVHLALASFANDRDECFPSVKTLATRCRCSESSVHRCLNEMVGEGTIQIVTQGGGHLSNLYKLLIPDQHYQGYQNSTGSTQTPQGSSGDTPGVLPSDPNKSSITNESIELGEEDLTQEERLILNVLRTTPGCTVNWHKDIPWARSLILDFPQINVYQEMRGIQAWMLDNPKKWKNARACYRRNLGRAAPEATKHPAASHVHDPWEGIPESTPIPDWAREP
jgi:hypothetical protein